MVKLNIGCGRDVKEGWLNVDQLVLDPRVEMWNLLNRWLLPDHSVEEIHCSHVIEHFDRLQRCWIMNEAYRVLQPGGKMTVIVPSWSSNRAYGDPTHQWPPVSEMWFFYLDKQWRDAQAPHTNDLLSCDFTTTWGYSMGQHLLARNQEYQQMAMNSQINAVMDIHATLLKRG